MADISVIQTPDGTSYNLKDDTARTNLSNKADKADTVLDNTLSMGRKANTTVGANSFAFGNDVTASSNYTVATGLSTKATSSYAKAEGRETTASGAYSHAEGGYSTSQGSYSHAEGNSSLASGIYSHAEGSHTTAAHQYSHSEGEYTYATGMSSHVSGRYNVYDNGQRFPAWTSGTSYNMNDKVSYNNKVYNCYIANNDVEFDETKWDAVPYQTFAEIVGMGSSQGRCNARAVDWKGNEYLYDDLYIGCDADSTGGTPVSSFSPQIGEIRMWSGSTAPDKWLICDGTLISRSTYFDLFCIIGTAYGGGDGSTTFSLPPFKGRSPLGAGESGANGHTNHALGSYGGEETHVLQSGELASHAHTFSKATAETKIRYTADRGTGSKNTPNNSGSSYTANWATTTLSLTLNNTGSNTAHNTMHPYCTVNFIIYTGVSST